MATGRLPDPNTAPVTAKGDLYTYSTVPAKLAVGNNGETLVADSSTTTGLRWQATEARNALHNSAFDIWQRGTSFAVTNGSTSYFTADRWQAYRAATGMTVSRQTIGSLGTTPDQRITYAARVQRDSGNTTTNEIYLLQTLETADSVPYSGKTVTLSYYARAGANYSAAGSGLVGAIITGTGTDNNQLTNWTNFGQIDSTVTLTTSWQRFTLTTTLANTVNQLGFRFYYTPSGTAGANDWFEITGVKFEVGSRATTYCRNASTLAGELAACQRYYVRFNGEAANSSHAMGIAYSTTGCSVNYQLPVSMRTYPTAVEYSALRLTENVNAYNVTNLTLSTDKGTLTCINCTISVASGLTQFRSYLLTGVNTPNYVGFSAEL